MCDSEEGLGDFFKPKPKTRRVKPKARDDVSLNAGPRGAPEECPGLPGRRCSADYLQHCISNCDLPGVLTCLETGSDVEERDQRDRTCLMRAVASGNYSPTIIQALLAARANVNATTSSGVTSLIMAAMTKGGRAVHLLLEARADVNHASLQGSTALMNCRRGEVAVMTRLLVARADANRAHGDGKTPMIIAAAEGDSRLVDTLLQANADVDAADDEGATALIAATERRHDAVVHLLIDASASLNARDVEGSSAYDIAMRESLPSIASEMEKVISKMVVGLEIGEVNETNGYPVCCTGMSGTVFTSFDAPGDCDVAWVRGKIAEEVNLHSTQVRLLCGVCFLEDDVASFADAVSSLLEQ